MDIPRGRLSWKARLLIAAALVVCYWTSFQPSTLLRGYGLHALGDPAYRGVGIFIPHLLLYSTFTAACCALVWWLLVRARLLPPPQLALTSRAALWGLIGGAVSIAVSLLFLPIAHLGELRWIGFDGWSIADNLFSNFYEEFIFRGLLLVGLTAVVGFWPAAVLSSIAFGAVHTQYPLPLRAYIAVVGVFWCWLARHARSLWAPWGAHMLTDLIVDALFS
jgi:membrane protease YdiL (CAAX protease family)